MRNSKPGEQLVSSKPKFIPASEHLCYFVCAEG